MEMKKIKKYIEAKDIEFFLANIPQITFEVTDACNLKCTYCGYGEFYSDHDNRENIMLPEEKAFKLLNYLNMLWDSPKNMSYKKNIFISFYGGEPLLNMNFIQKVVDYIENLNCSTRTFTFSMTTNAILLNKHIDYLVKHSFHTLISLDGNEKNTEYRVDKKGLPAYNNIIKNIDFVKEKHPEYFQRFVNFNAVLHNKNSVDDIYLFFKEKYHKIPRIGELNNIAIREDKKTEFEKMYFNASQSLFQSEHYPKIIKDMRFQLGTYQSVNTYLMKYSNFVYQDYNELLFGKPNLKNLAPTGTCMPFSKKIFVTANGKLLPCERIGQQFALGIITENKLILDFEAIARKYNSYYEKIDKQCKSCYNKKICTQCMFNIEDLENEPVCYGHMDSMDFKKYQNDQIMFLANNPDEYVNLMENTINI